MKAIAVQFRGVDNVVDAYRANGMAPFAILCDKCIIHTGDDLDDDDIEQGAVHLRKFLLLLQKGGSEAKYTLQVYRLREGQEIDSTTPFKRSFNFTLWSATELSPYQERYTTQTKALEDRIDELEEKLSETEEGGPITVGKVLNGFMAMPEFRNAIAMGAIGLMSRIIPMPQKAGKVAGSDGSQAGQAQSVLTAEQVERANQAMQILARLDPDLGDNLLKIARIAERDPAKYQMFAKML
jgi:hypothetical protein